MGKNKKEHRKKVSKRNEELKKQKSKFEKAQKEFLMKIIEAEKQKGLFDNNKTMPGFDVPMTLPTVESGPKI
jgi:hypothetical protein